MLPMNLLQLEKKVPEAYLLAAVIENRILDKGEVEHLANLPPLDRLLGETVNILNTPAQYRCYPLLVD